MFKNKISLLSVSLGLITWLAPLVQCAPANVSYDQRQNGKVNVHISIKDVAIILQQGEGLAGSDDDINYDYDYDYEHLTVKPNGIWATLGQSSTTTAAPVTPNQTTSEAVPSATTEVSSVDLPTSLATNEVEAETVMVSDTQHTVTEVTVESSTMKVTSPKGTEETTPNRHKYAWNGDLEEIPVEVIIEPVLKHKQRKHLGETGSDSRPTRRTRTRIPTAKFGLDQFMKLLSKLDSKDTDDKEY